ncbi:MAG: hypothetical protein MR051_03435 [Lentisphaeria bacterium]|nr:hypothetical protein [Lentisphaeria bacterium]
MRRNLLLGSCIVGGIGFLMSLVPNGIGRFSIFVVVPAFLLAVTEIIISSRKKERYGMAAGVASVCLVGIVISSWQMKLSSQIKREMHPASMDKEECGEKVTVPIIGFGGYNLGEKLNVEVAKKYAKKGCIKVRAEKKFRNFDSVYLYFTPKTYMIYRISSVGKGDENEFQVIVASLEQKYQAKMGDDGLLGTKIFGDGNRSISVKDTATELGLVGNTITFEDERLYKQNEREESEIAKSKVTTEGL